MAGVLCSRAALAALAVVGGAMGAAELEHRSASGHKWRRASLVFEPIPNGR